jgi:ABC-type uncharacterized transport system involved in gliding motility auxiliary subunit
VALMQSRSKLTKPSRPSFHFSIDALKGPALALGALLILAGLGAWLINGFDTVTRVLLAVGILLFGVFVAIDPEDVWRSMTTRSALYGGNALLLSVAIIGILGLLNVVAQNRHQRWDLTANKQYTLSEQSLQVVSELPNPVQMTAFFEADDGRRNEISDLLREYETRSNGKITYEVVDPIAEPSRAQAAGIKELGTTVMFMGTNRQSVTGTRESDITTGLLRLTNPTPKKMYFTIGHGERRVDQFARTSYSQLKTSLESDNFVVEPLQVEGIEEIPADATVLVIAHPTTAFGDQAKQAIQSYVANGGKLMLLTEPTIGQAPQVSLNDFVSTWGVEIGTLPVAEGNPQFVLARDPLTPVIARFPTHKITEGLNLTFFPTPTHIETSPDNRGGATITNLLQTTDRSWAENDPRQLNFDEGTDKKGPLTIGVAIEATPENQPPGGGDEADSKKTRVIVFGDADFVSNEVQGIPVPSSNRDLFLNAANWLASDESLIAIRPKERDSRNMFLTAAQSNLVFFSSALFLPLIVLALGGFVWWSRR